jgi:hypothetical protein
MPIPAAQYLRVSTEHQQYSLELRQMLQEVVSRQAKFKAILVLGRLTMNLFASRRARKFIIVPRPSPTTLRSRA